MIEIAVVLSAIVGHWEDFGIILFLLLFNAIVGFWKNARRARIQQDDSGVTVSYVDLGDPATPQLAKADWCVGTIPLSILSQLPIDVGTRMKAAIDAVPYAASVKIGLQFRCRFWEEDEAIYGGISYTDLPIRQIAYPNTGYNSTGKACCSAPMFSGVGQCLRRATALHDWFRAWRAALIGTRGESRTTEGD